MNIGFLSFSDFWGKNDVGSTRIRVNWLIDNWNAGIDFGKAERFKIGKKYDIMVYQKVYWAKHAKAFPGLKILDLCDPDWFDWGTPFMEMLLEVDAVTCSSLSLAKQITKFTDKPVAFIPDRVDLSKLVDSDGKRLLKEHKGEAKKAVWFGYSQNFEMPAKAIPTLLKHGLGLIVIADKNFPLTGLTKKIELTNLPWTEGTWSQDILKGDFVINPKSNAGKWKFKSDNKTFHSWALGMPVAKNEEEMMKFLSEEGRKEEAEKRLKEVESLYRVEHSVAELKEFMKELYENRN